MLHLLGQVLFGLVVGIIAKLVVPGHDPGGFFMTAVIGILGSLLGTFLGRMIKRDPNYSAHWVMSILGAIILLVVYRLLMR
jgi:uncharacterized membrane protein YeaQ/YmgE (transglycosylase-associated protein family)